ncbi:MAG: family 10 glycosylhydrolase [Peptococcaceae bacterium]|jgi:uncharacterized lipoprotein YddW (UPF0748 family)/N-acetylmuramoyl-L-alanine amidase|nr:family 10 glycosylhydrolase [Peptococcaceae bacterium]
MSKSYKNLSAVTIYIIVAVITVFCAIGAARQFAPELYYGFRQGVYNLPLIERMSGALSSLSLFFSGSGGDKAAAVVGNAPQAKDDVPDQEDTEPPHLPDEEEMRGVWIATVYNIDFPKSLNPDRQKQELIDILDITKEAGLNTVFFQVRPHGDALYASQVFPWSEYLTGTAGEDPGYDPLAFLLSEADKRGIRVHAWINPYRLTMGTTAKPMNTHDFLPKGSPVKNCPDLTMSCGDGKLYLNPGEPEAMRLVVEGVVEIVEKYKVDGIHFDDYFYPSDPSFNDSAAYEKYGKPAGLSLADWRRLNTTTLMRMVNDAIKEVRPGVEFGISPSGIWQNKSSTPLGSDTNGFESYNRIYADSRLWVKEEIVDYIVPQIYWAIGTKGSDYDILARWWRSVALGTNVKLYIGHAAYRVGTDGAWLKPTEIGSQITLNRSIGAIDGSVFYGYSKIAENALSLRDQLKEFFIEMDLAQPLKIAYPASGSTFATENSYIIGSADPRYPLTVNGKPVACTVSGYFSIYVPLAIGKNEFVFRHQDQELEYVLNSNRATGGTSGGGGSGAPAAPKPTQLPKPLVYVTKDDQTVVRSGPSADYDRLQPLRKGVKGYVVAEHNGYYLMDSGNWTYKPNVDVLVDESLPLSKTSSAAISPGAAYVELAFQVPYFTSYYVNVTHDGIWLSLHKTTGQPVLRRAADPLFDEVLFSQDGDNAVYYLPLKKAGRLYGYNINYDEAKKLLTFRFNNPLTLSLEWLAATEEPLLTAEDEPDGKMPNANAASPAANAPASNAPAANAPAPVPLPLTGIVIMLDPGHGGRDIGATGPAGSRGKLEKDVNLDLGLALEKVLKEAGAEVVMIRSDDSYIDLDDRADSIRARKPDLAISLHRNSMGAGSDISKLQGVLALYSHQQSAVLAGYVREALLNGTTHHDGGMRWQSLAMCRIEECPVILLELGFISNPADYERMNRKSMIQKEAQAILRGVIAYLADS